MRNFSTQNLCPISRPISLLFLMICHSGGSPRAVYGPFLASSPPSLRTSPSTKHSLPPGCHSSTAPNLPCPQLCVCSKLSPAFGRTNLPHSSSFLTCVPASQPVQAYFVLLPLCHSLSSHLLLVILASSLPTSSHCLIVLEPVHRTALLQLVFYLRTVLIFRKILPVNHHGRITRIWRSFAGSRLCVAENLGGNKKLRLVIITAPMVPFLVHKLVLSN